MLLGLGTDIVDVTRVRLQLERDKDDVRSALFTAAELDSAGPNGSPRLACAFAAKEAFFKALGQGWEGGLAWRDVELDQRDVRHPTLTLSGAALTAAERIGVRQIHVSLSSGPLLAMASVVLDSERAPPVGLPVET